MIARGKARRSTLLETVYNAFPGVRHTPKCVQVNEGLDVPECICGFLDRLLRALEHRLGATDRIVARLRAIPNPEGMHMAAIIEREERAAER